MRETALDRFLQIKSYNDINEIVKWLNEEAEHFDADLPQRYTDMLSLSMLSDIYYNNIPEEVHKELEKRCQGKPPVIVNMFNAFRIAESRMVAIASWGDTVQEMPDADRVRKYIYSLIEEYHENGWDIHVSSVAMEEGEPDEFGVLQASATEEALDEFEADILGILTELFNNFGEELSFQLFFNKPGKAAEKAFILVNCLWMESPDGYGDCLIGPFVVPGKGKGDIELLAPDNIGLQILSEKPAFT